MSFVLIGAVAAAYVVVLIVVIIFIVIVAKTQPKKEPILVPLDARPPPPIPAPVFVRSPRYQRIVD